MVCVHVCNLLFQYERSFSRWTNHLTRQNGLWEFLEENSKFLIYYPISSVKISYNRLLTQMLSVEYYWCWLYQLSVTLCVILWPKLEGVPVLYGEDHFRCTSLYESNSTHCRILFTDIFLFLHHIFKRRLIYSFTYNVIFVLQILGKCLYFFNA